MSSNEKEARNWHGTCAKQARHVTGSADRKSGVTTVASNALFGLGAWIREVKRSLAAALSGPRDAGWWRFVVTLLLSGLSILFSVLSLIDTVKHVVQVSSLAHRVDSIGARIERLVERVQKLDR